MMSLTHKIRGCFIFVAVLGISLLGERLHPNASGIFAAQAVVLSAVPTEDSAEIFANRPFVGSASGRLVMAGGSDRPTMQAEIPSKENRAENHLSDGDSTEENSTMAARFSDTIVIYEKDSHSDIKAKIADVKLPTPVASGSCAVTDLGLVLIGGRTSNGITPSVSLLTSSANGKNWSVEPLPPLPIPLADSQAAVLGTVVYVAGGVTPATAGSLVASDAFYSLDFAKKGTDDFRWTPLPPLPSPRSDAALVVQNRKDQRKGLFLFGGSGQTDGMASRLTDAWSFAPNDKEWSPVEVTPVDEQDVSFARMAIASGTTHVLFFGDKADDAGKNSLFITGYNVITGRFFSLGGVEVLDKTQEEIETAARPDAVPVRWGNDYCLVGGDSGGTVLRVDVQARQNRLGIVNIVVIAVYFFILAWMGYYFSKRQKGTEDYFRGGARIPWWAVGVSLYGAALSAISYMAVPAKSYMTNWELIFLSSAYLWAAPILTAFFIPRLRQYNLTSAYEYLEKRFNVVVRVLGSGIFISFQIVRMAIMLFLPAIAINVVTNFDILTCIILVGAVSVVYTMFGGIEAVIWTDVLQVFILMGGIVLALVVISFQLDGGLLDVLRVGWEDHKFTCVDPRFVWNEPTIWVILTSSFFIFIVPFSSDQTMVQRYFVGKGSPDAVRGLWTFAWLTLPGTCLLFFLGTAFYVFYKAHPAACSVLLDNNDSLMPWFVITQMPVGVSGLLIVAILAASMSSLSASMNSIAAAWTVDFHQRLLRFPESSALWTARASTLISGALAIFLAIAMATWDIGSFWDEYNRLLGLVTSSLAGIFFLGLLSRRANTLGAIAGLVLSFLFQVYVVEFQLVYILLYSGTGFVSAIVFGYLASLVFAQFSRQNRENGKENTSETAKGADLS